MSEEQNETSKQFLTKDLVTQCRTTELPVEVQGKCLLIGCDTIEELAKIAVFYRTAYFTDKISIDMQLSADDTLRQIGYLEAE